jgi:iron complex outermembrane receptor protein
MTVATTAHAEEAAGRQGARAGSLMEEIVVTATKREESIQEVPISVAAVTGQRMDDMHATTLEALQGTIPNVQIQSFANVPHGAVFNIRGMGVIEPDPYGGTTVVVVEDGVPQYFNMTALLDTYDIQRVEVLRGPQGTLFGANSTGGVVQVINEAPTGETGAKLEASYGNYDLIELRGAVEFPVVADVLAARISGSHQSRDGFVTNIVNNQDMGSRDRSAVRVQLAFTPNDAFDARLIGAYSRHRDGGQDSAIGNIPGEALYVPAGTTFPSDAYPDTVARQPMYASPCAPGERCKAPSKYLSANSSVPDVSDMDTYSATLLMNWSTDIGEFTSITGFKDFELHDFHDQDWTPVFLDDTERLTSGSQFTQELRGVFQISDNFELMLGGFYATYEWKHFQDFRIQFAADGLRQLTQNDSDTDSYSAFAQAYLDITDRLRLRAGLRYTHEETKFDSVISTFIDTRGAADLRGKGLNDQAGPYEILLGVLDPSQTNVCDFKRCSESWSNVGGKVGLEFDLDDGAMMYGYYARGFKSGGFVGRIGVVQDIGPYDEEYVDTVEVGIKSDWLDNRLRLNVAAFHNWYDDIQLASIYFTEDEFGNTINGNSILNAAKAKTKGFEVDAIALPMENLAVNVSFGYLDAKYEEFPFVDPADTTGNTIIDLSGETLQNAPKWTASTGVEFAFQAGMFEIISNVQYRYVGKKFNTNLQNTPRSEIQPTHFVDLNVHLTPDEGNWSVGFWARNLTDERYISSVFDAPGVIGLIDYQDPRTYGVTVRLEM